MSIVHHEFGKAGPGLNPPKLSVNVRLTDNTNRPKGAFVFFDMADDETLTLLDSVSKPGIDYGAWASVCGNSTAAQRLWNPFAVLDQALVSGQKGTATVYGLTLGLVTRTTGSGTQSSAKWQAFRSKDAVHVAEFDTPAATTIERVLCFMAVGGTVVYDSAPVVALAQVYMNGLDILHTPYSAT